MSEPGSRPVDGRWPPAGRGEPRAAPPEVVNLAEKLAGFEELWSPRVVGELNGQRVKLAKVKGEFVWHHHEDADELFLVVRGRLTLQIRGDADGARGADDADDADDTAPGGAVRGTRGDGVRDLVLEEGELAIVPRGVEHRPVAEEECHILLFEPAGTLNTGNVRDERTVEEPERI